MTRVLSELLGVNRTEFSQGLARLERASGGGSADIRLTSEIKRATLYKLRQLGLDAHDTSGPELYRALEERLKADDQRLIELLRQKHGSANPLDDVSVVAKELASLPLNKTCFALKSSVAKGLLKRSLPKQAMKALGYRSFDSMLKHEELAAVYAACFICESATWQKQLVDKYKKLSASDFEIRPMTVEHPESPKWRNLAQSHVAKRRHNILSFRELGAIVLLPMPDERPPAAATTCLLLTLHAMNEIKAASTYLKLCQVKPDFGRQIQTVVASEPLLETELFGRPVPWQIIQRYYARFTDKFRAELFEPHIQADDLSWHSIEKVLSYIDPRLEFWLQTNHLSLLHERQPVSFNIIDVALNYCNKVDYHNRLTHYFKHSLWHELIIRYLKHDNVEQLVLGGLEKDLVDTPELMYNNA